MKTAIKTAAFFLLLCSNLALGQTPVQIINQKSEKHVRLKGTTINLIVPKGFVSSPNFVGFQQPESGASILLNQLFGAPFDELVAGFTKEAWATRGVQLLKTEDVTIHHSTRKAKLLHATTIAAGIEFKRQILVLSSPSGVDMFICNYPNNVSTAYDEIMSLAIRTLYFNDAEGVDTDEAVDFMLSSEGTSLIRKNIMLSSIRFIYSEADKGEFLMAVKSVRALASDDLKGAAISMAKTVPELIDLKVIESQALEVDGMKGFELVGEATYQGSVKGLIYQLITVTEGAYYRVVGNSKSQNKAHIEDYQKVARTLKRK